MKMKVGQKLQSIREDRKLSQSEFAELLNVSQPTYSRYERDEIMVDLDFLMRVAKTFDVPIQEFLPDSIIFHNHNHNGYGGVVFGNLIVNYGNDAIIADMQNKIDVLESKLKDVNSK